MPTAEVLRDRHAAAKDREAQVEKLIVADELDLAKILNEIESEREERDQFEKQRRQLRKALDEEIAADKQGDGERSEEWEARKEAKRDELADLIEGSESRLDRLVERVATKQSALDDLRKRDSGLEDRIARLAKKIERIETETAGQLTKSYHVAEFDCRNGTPVPSYMVASLKALCVRHLQPLRDAGGVVSINSGYRTAAYNAAIGGASESYHVYTIRKTAPAADHIQSGRSAPAVQQWHEAHTPFDGMGFYAGFTHGDDRGYRSRWYGAS